MPVQYPRAYATIARYLGKEIADAASAEALGRCELLICSALNTWSEAYRPNSKAPLLVSLGRDDPPYGEDAP
jgi:hypothetical protein